MGDRCELYHPGRCPTDCPAKITRRNIINEVGQELYFIFRKNSNINPLLAFWVAYCSVLEKANKVCRENNFKIN